MRLNIDLHCHSHFSADGIAHPDKMVAQAKRKGLHGFAITDHNTCACIDYFIKKGYIRADGQPVDDFLIIPGQEISTSKGHLLALGVYLPDMKGISPKEAVDIVHSKGGLAIPAHPYDFFRSGIPEADLENLPIDALEVFNAATTFAKYNRQAFEYATRKGLPMTAGSDAHHLTPLGKSYTILEPKSFDVQGVLESIRNPVGRHEEYLTGKDIFVKTFYNLFRFLRSAEVRRLRATGGGIP